MARLRKPLERMTGKIRLRSRLGAKAALPGARMTAKRHKEIAKKAAAKRWGNS
jgi:hypothetical protein